jgi:D-glycero-D-manno-heptose 1,7-bisphosphate phosphatase
VDILPGVPEALRRLKHSAFRLIVVTNQPDIARGTLTAQDVDAIDEFLMRELPLDRVYVCPHDSAQDCSCRKPRPGLLMLAAEHFGLDLRTSYMVGDRWRDIEAGRAAGCKTFFVDHKYAERQPERPDYVVASLADAAAIILSTNTPV